MMNAVDVTHFFCSFLFFSAGPPSLPSVMASGEPLPSGVPAGTDSITEHIRPVYCMYSVLITNTHVNSM